jgi:hypothetical protein
MSIQRPIVEERRRENGERVSAEGCRTVEPHDEEIDKKK